jgi:hypothetical protein
LNSLKKFLKTAGKGLQMNSVQPGHNVFFDVLNILCRLQLPRGLRHKLSSLIERWDRGFDATQVMDVCMCVHSVFVLFFVQIEAL